MPPSATPEGLLRNYQLYNTYEFQTRAKRQDPRAFMLGYHAAMARRSVSQVLPTKLDEGSPESELSTHPSLTPRESRSEPGTSSGSLDYPGPVFEYHEYPAQTNPSSVPKTICDPPPVLSNSLQLALDGQSVAPKHFRPKVAGKAPQQAVYGNLGTGPFVSPYTSTRAFSPGPGNKPPLAPGFGKQATSSSYGMPPEPLDYAWDNSLDAHYKGDHEHLSRSRPVTSSIGAPMSLPAPLHEPEKTMTMESIFKASTSNGSYPVAVRAQKREQSLGRSSKVSGRPTYPATHPVPGQGTAKRSINTHPIQPSIPDDQSRGRQRRSNKVMPSSRAYQSSAIQSHKSADSVKRTRAR